MNKHQGMMDGQQYNSYHVFTQQLKFKSPEKTLPLLTGYLDQFDRYFLLKTNDGDDVQVMQTDDKGGVESSYDIEGPATPFVRLSFHQVLLFASKTHTLTLIDFNNQDRKDIPLSSPSHHNDSRYQLLFFTKTQIVCLAEKIKDNSSLHLTFFSFSPNQPFISQTASHETEPGTYKGGKLHVVTPFGKLGWCCNFQNVMEVQLFEGPDRLTLFQIDLTSLTGFPAGEEFQVMTIWQTDNYLFLVINPMKTPSFDRGYSPIIKINLTTTNLETAFVQLRGPELLLRDCLNLQDYLVLFSAFDQGEFTPYYIYDKQLQSIVKEQKAEVSLTPIRAYQANTYFLVSNNKQISISVSTIKRVNSLAFQRMLEIIEKANAVKGQIQTGIVIVGMDKTGKSTLRNHLAGKKLVHRYNEQYGYDEVVPEGNEEQGLEHEEQRECLPWMNITDKVAIVDVPDWKYRGDYFRTQIRIFFARLFRIFKQLQFIITISEEFISSSDENEMFFSSVLQMVGEEQLHNYITIVLTKSETAEDSLATFHDHIELITDINGDTGSMLNSIEDAGRIIVFQNKELSQIDGKEMLEKILTFEKLSLKKGGLNMEKGLSGRSAAIDRIYYESEYYMRLINAYLVVACHKLAPSLFPDAENTLNAHISHHHPGMNPLKQLTTLQNVAPAFIAALAELKNFFAKEEKSEEAIEKLKTQLINLAETLAKDLQQESYFATAITALISSIRIFIELPLERTTGKDQTIFSSFNKILKEEPEGILGQSLKNIITTLQAIPEVQSSPQIQELSSLFGKSLPKKKRIVEQEMTLQQQKREILRRRPTALETVCALPSNALKMDIICDQLLKFSKKAKLSKEDYKPLCFYLRQGSKVCEFHGLYYEAIVLLAVVPDFAGIEKLIDSFAQHIRRNTTYDVKKLLKEHQKELVEKLMTLARDCLRDGLVKKLINLWTFCLETNFKPAKLREEAQKKAADYLSSEASIKDYKQRLEKKVVRDFYNMADSDFKKLLAEKAGLVEKCIRLQKEEEYRKSFEDAEALRYVLDDLPMPS